MELDSTPLPVEAAVEDLRLHLNSELMKMSWRTCGPLRSIIVMATRNRVHPSLVNPVVVLVGTRRVHLVDGIRTVGTPTDARVCRDWAVQVSSEQRLSPPLILDRTTPLLLPEEPTAGIALAAQLRLDLERLIEMCPPLSIRALQVSGVAGGRSRAEWSIEVDFLCTQSSSSVPLPELLTSSSTIWRIGQKINYPSVAEGVQNAARPLQIAVRDLGEAPD